MSNWGSGGQEQRAAEGGVVAKEQGSKSQSRNQRYLQLWSGAA